MKAKNSYSAFDFVLAAAILFAFAVLASHGCEKEKEISRPENLLPSGSLVGSSECKLTDTPVAKSQIPPDQDCVEWHYTPDGKLMLKHINAGFNCCPGELTADITFSGDTITIEEHEQEALCHCLCLYDLDYEISNLETGTYRVRFIEPYVDPRETPLEVTIYLESNPNGSFCVKRPQYPWHEPTNSEEPWGRIVRATGCGRAGTSPREYPGDLSCVEWQNEGAVLRLWHINAGFNCCARIGADITIEGSSITITEWESGSPCDCMCLFEVEYEIIGLAPINYKFTFNEPYRRHNEEALEFSLDLQAFPMGVQCAYRNHYPWGYSSTLEEDEARLSDMYRALTDFAGTPSCNDDRECRYIGIGKKPCGGPWSYLVYSTPAVDEYELRYRVSRYNAWNHGMNRRYNLLSTCDVPPVPHPTCLAGACREDDKPN